MKFGIRGQLIDKIKCVKFLVDRFRGRSSDTPKIAISHWLAASTLQQCTHTRATLWKGIALSVVKYPVYLVCYGQWRYCGIVISWCSTAVLRMETKISFVDDTIIIATIHEYIKYINIPLQNNCIANIFIRDVFSTSHLIWSLKWNTFYDKLWHRNNSSIFCWSMS